MVTIPIQNHGEQLGNSEKVERMKIGIRLGPSNTNGYDIAQAIHKILDDQSYLKNIQKIKEVADGLNGINNALNIIRSYIWLFRVESPDSKKFDKLQLDPWTIN
jgi:UDP:flavonoid glycosyltransferase YjiC (YdhE family)